MIRLIKTPQTIKFLYPSILWNCNRRQNSIFLTFDDGPTPEATPLVLSLLERFNANATFFCVGDNIRKHPLIFKNVVAQGHCIGNHTFNHLSGWNSKTEHYLENIKQCTEIIQSSGYQPPVRFFRPPFGKLGYTQFHRIKKNYRIVMWDTLTYDFSPGPSTSLLFQKITRKTMPGSIVVFHDSLKSLPGLQFLLEPFLKYFSDRGFAFHSLDKII